MRDDQVGDQIVAGSSRSTRRRCMQIEVTASDITSIVFGIERFAGQVLTDRHGWRSSAAIRAGALQDLSATDAQGDGVLCTCTG